MALAFENVRLMHKACKYEEVKVSIPDKQKVVSGIKHVFLSTLHSVKLTPRMSPGVTLVCKELFKG